MKISKLFHWLYASVMFIPLMIAPIFALAVRSDNNFQPIEIQYDTRVQQINYKYESNVVNNFNDLVTENVYYLDDFVLTSNTSETYQFDLQCYSFNDLNVINSSGGSYVDELYQKGYSNNSDNFLGIRADTGATCYLDYTNSNCYVTYAYDKDFQFNFTSFTFSIINGLNDFIRYCNDVNVNLPQYTDYNIIDNITYVGNTITYSDTDVGSQLIYTLYNATEKYFNFNQFLGIGNLFDWFQLNVFNGNAPLGFYIFWNLLIYWLLVSIAWLIFDIAMFVPKLAHRWLDKASLE